MSDEFEEKFYVYLLDGESQKIIDKINSVENHKLLAKVIKDKITELVDGVLAAYVDHKFKEQNQEFEFLVRNRANEVVKQLLLGNKEMAHRLGITSQWETDSELRKQIFDVYKDDVIAAEVGIRDDRIKMLEEKLGMRVSDTLANSV